jgi:LytS/YehU family sensor histidine kinase
MDETLQRIATALLLAAILSGTIGGWVHHACTWRTRSPLHSIRLRIEITPRRNRVLWMEFRMSGNLRKD